MLELNGVEHVYPNGTRALDSVIITVGKGMFGLLGPNGAGKSSLMKAIATLQTPTAGKIRFADIDVLAEPGRLRAVLGYLPQEFGVFPPVSSYDLLDYMASLKGIVASADRRATVETLLVQTNLWNVRTKAVVGFSGGMRQRFGIAQALIGNPELIIVDEPTAGLDPKERNRFHNLLVEIGEHVVVLLSTHIVDDIDDLCPQMAILAAGRIQLEGAPSELIARSKGRVWSKTIERDSLDEVKAAYEVVSTRLLAGRTIVHVLSEKDPANGFGSVEGGLEDVYLTTVARSRHAAAQIAA